MRTTLLLAAVIAALVIPVVAHRRPSPPEPPRTENVEVATVGDQLPFGCPGAWFCNCDSPMRMAVLVQDDALWLGTNRTAPPLRFARDGSEREWPALEAALVELDVTRNHALEIALDDHATYTDLLQVMQSGRAAGMKRFTMVQAALPVWPNHGWEGGMGI